VASEIEDETVDNENCEISRQEVTFLRRCRKIKGFGSLREDFYTKFKPKIEDLGL